MRISKVKNQKCLNKRIHLNSKYANTRFGKKKNNNEWIENIKVLSGL